MRIATLTAMGLLALSGACGTDGETNRAVAPTPNGADIPAATASDPRATTATVTPPLAPAGADTPTPSVVDTTATVPPGADIPAANGSDTRATTATPGGSDVAAPVEFLVRYQVSGRHVGDSFAVAADGSYTLDTADDGLPPATGTLTAAEFKRLKAAIAATSDVTPPQAPETLRSESPPVVGVTTMAGSASALRNDDMPGPWGTLAARLARLMTAHLPEAPFVATLAPDATRLTLRQRSTAPVPACFAVVEAIVTGRGDAVVVRDWESPPLEPGATAPELAHGPRRAHCTPSPRAPGWTLEIPLAVGAPKRRGETLYATVHAIVAGEHTTVSAEPRTR